MRPWKLLATGSWRMGQLLTSATTGELWRTPPLDRDRDARGILYAPEQVICGRVEGICQQSDGIPAQHLNLAALNPRQRIRRNPGLFRDLSLRQPLPTPQESQSFPECEHTVPPFLSIKHTPL
jgi:hypothetical protein